jgi:hypothetical protein
LRSYDKRQWIRHLPFIEELLSNDALVINMSETIGRDQRILEFNEPISNILISGLQFFKFIIDQIIQIISREFDGFKEA